MRGGVSLGLSGMPLSWGRLSVMHGSIIGWKLISALPLRLNDIIPIENIEIKYCFYGGCL